MLPRPLLTALTILISLAWAANVIVGFLLPERHDASLNAVFAVVVGGVYALSGNGKSLRQRIGDAIAGDPKDPEDSKE